MTNVNGLRRRSWASSVCHGARTRLRVGSVKSAACSPRPHAEDATSAGNSAALLHLQHGAAQKLAAMLRGQQRDRRQLDDLTRTRTPRRQLLILRALVVPRHRSCSG